jgi:uncharacterized iron-regulated protein
MKLSALFLLISIPVSASAANTPAAAPAQSPRTADGAPGYCIFGAQSGKIFSGEAAFKSIVWKSDVIYVGETHDQAKDHLAQLETLKALRIARGSRIAVGFEMLDTTLQPILDKYAAGEFTEEKFLSETDWAKKWGFDFGLYKSLFDFIVQNKLKALALNVPKTVVSKIARGGLDGLAAEDRQLLPEKVTITAHKKYLEYLKASFDGHGDSPMAKMFTWENYLASMAAWNEGMGAKIAEFVNANPGWAVLVVATNGHVVYNEQAPPGFLLHRERRKMSRGFSERA